MISIITRIRLFSTYKQQMLVPFSPDANSLSFFAKKKNSRFKSTTQVNSCTLVQQANYKSLLFYS